MRLTTDTIKAYPKSYRGPVHGVADTKGVAITTPLSQAVDQPGGATLHAVAIRVADKAPGSKAYEALVAYATEQGYQLDTSLLDLKPTDTSTKESI